MSVSQCHVYCLVNSVCLKCENATRCFQSGGGPGRGLLCDCEIFTKVPCELYLALTQDSETADDGDEDAIAVIFVVDHGDIVAVVRPAHIVSQGPRQAGHVR